MGNLLLKADSYKLSHYNQYPEGTEYVYSYIEPRKGSTPIPVLGIQKFCERLYQGFDHFDVIELEEFCEKHGVPFNKEWHTLIEEYPQGELPLKVHGVPEGTVVDSGTPVATIVNTDPKYYWLTSFFETMFLRDVWYPSTVAAISRRCKVIIKEGMLRTGADLETLPFKLHDFGARGATTSEAAAVGGAGHLLNFLGSDTLEAIEYISDFYSEPMAGFSIPATEHSTVTSWGRTGEKAMYENYIRNNLGEGKIAACVSDSYNIWEAIDMWHELDPVLQEVGGTLVIRPDSGDPIATPIEVIERLMQRFGYIVNGKGFKVLPDRIRVIQGDGITVDSLRTIISVMISKGLSIDNIAFGMGGGLLQHCDRDTYGWAMKCSAVCVNGEWRDVYKDPIGGSKTSKRGLVWKEGTFHYSDSPLLTNVRMDMDRGNWKVYYNNGRLSPCEPWGILRQRAEVMI